MATSRQLHRIATNPTDYIRFATTGRLPQVVRPKSPLIQLLEQLNPRDRMRISGLTVSPPLGYAGTRRFANAEQALNWIRPRSEMLEGESWPAESWRVKSFVGPVSLTALLECAASYPEGLLQRYPHLE